MRKHFFFFCFLGKNSLELKFEQTLNFYKISQLLVCLIKGCDKLKIGWKGVERCVNLNLCL